MVRIIAGNLMFALMPCLALAVPAPAAPIDVWIDQLGDPSPARRIEARHRLQRLGEPALAKLRSAAKSHPLPIVRQQAAEAAACIERGEVLSIGTPSGYWFNRVAFVDDDRHALVTGGALILMDLRDARETRRDLELQFARIGLAISPDGKRFATGHQHDVVVRIGDIKSGKVTQLLKGHRAGVHAVAFAPEGDRLVSGSLDATLRLWDLKTGVELRQFAGVTDSVRSVDFSADGKSILSGHFGAKSQFLVRAWDAKTGKELRSFKRHTQDVSGVFFLPGGEEVVSTGLDGAVFVWRLDNGKEVRRMTHQGGIYGAALSPDGKRLLTAGFGDQTVRLWELSSGRELKGFSNKGAATLGVAFSRDGRFALSSDARTMIRLWRLPE